MDDRKHADSHLYVDRSPTCLVYARLSSRERISIAVAVTLGIALSVPLSASALSVSAPSNTAMQQRIAALLRRGDLIGPLVNREYLDDEDTDAGPVVDFGLYYGPRIRYTVPLPARVQILPGSNNTRSEIGCVKLIRKWEERPRQLVRHKEWLRIRIPITEN
jgi:hypothetical protein